MKRNNEEKEWSTMRTARRLSSLRELLVTYEGDNKPVDTRPLDISSRGMFINTHRSFSEGSVLTLQFRLALSGAEIRTRSEVRYSLPGVGVGVEFVQISSESVRAIEKEIKLRTGPRLRKKPSARRR
jgi:hypothetical protein